MMTELDFVRPRLSETDTKGLATFEDKLTAVRTRLLNHPLFECIQTFAQMRYFMEHHVFAVWDFMSLLKTLQIQLTSLSVPWMPPKDRTAARFINEIVMTEESDQLADGSYISHFELYLDAMRDAGANTLMIDAFMASMHSTGSFEHGLSAAGVAMPVRSFVRSTMKFCKLEPHQVAAAFLYGREDIIAEMFTRLLAKAPPSHAANFKTLKVYLERHIEIDGGSHSVLAKRLMSSLCGHDTNKWNAARAVALDAIQARYQLWDGILASLPST